MNYDNYDDENSNIKLTATTVEENKTVYAISSEKKDGPFYCPETLEELIVRKCYEKQDHFAFKARKSPVGAKESALHRGCIEEIRDALQAKYPNGNWLDERTLKAEEEKKLAKVKPDISGRIDGKGIIIEIQASTLSIKKILHRTSEYTKRKAFILWIVPLEKELGSEIFRPRLFERFLHSMYYGRIYYWYKGLGTKLIPVHYGLAHRHIEVNEWYSEDGTYNSVGGYDKPYSRVKTPLFGPITDLTSFSTENRDFFELKNEKLSIPKSNIYKDNLAPWWKEKKKESS